MSAELLDPLRQLHRGAQSAEAALLARSRVVYATPAWYAAMYWLRRVQTMRERLALCAAALKGEAHDAETFAALRDQATLDLRRRGEPWQGLDAETVVAWWVLRWGWLLADARRAAAAPDPINARAA
ncbi:MAG: hypothetical protein H6948_01035 [Zoogloeaceae bacterium]|nr:hypothetical protein [Zoogloeaceae bacterium]